MFPVGSVVSLLPDSPEYGLVGPVGRVVNVDDYCMPDSVWVDFGDCIVECDPDWIAFRA